MKGPDLAAIRPPPELIQKQALSACFLGACFATSDVVLISPLLFLPTLMLTAWTCHLRLQVALGVSNWPQPQQQQQQQQQQQLQPLQQGQLSVTAAGQSTELLTDLQAVELKLYELQQLQLQLQQQQLLLQQQLLQQKHQHSMQQWGLQDTTPAPEYSTGELQPVLQMGRQPSKSGALSPVQNRQENGVNSNNASVMAAELHGDAAGAERAGVCLEGQQIKREISTATSVSLDTNISEMKAEQAGGTRSIPNQLERQDRVIIAGENPSDLMHTKLPLDHTSAIDRTCLGHIELEGSAVSLISFNISIRIAMKAELGRAHTQIHTQHTHKHTHTHTQASKQA
eukprot:1161981-Pelagomonas_calceolata.AAC.15